MSVAKKKIDYRGDNPPPKKKIQKEKKTRKYNN